MTLPTMKAITDDLVLGHLPTARTLPGLELSITGSMGKPDVQRQLHYRLAVLILRRQVKVETLGALKFYRRFPSELPALEGYP